ncbi:ABC transporter substrate-binding protein [Roseateles sp. BYS96W]|uniref:ABC transporter substrate-binding protein n=1 Tax=Pelomonas nitida TaxID=3299027 RepID=A0ABW7GC09_9BURK
MSGGAGSGTTRRAAVAILATTASFWGHAQGNAPLRIGFQKGSFNLALLKSYGLLEQRLAGTRVQWIEFPAGPHLLEALALGSVAFGATGDAPPVFAQAAGKDVVYVGAEPPKPDSSALLVRPDSALTTLAGLKGRRIALQKGSSAHFLTVQAVKKAGLSWADIQPVYLAPAEARAAFERGAVDVWAVWDPEGLPTPRQWAAKARRQAPIKAQRTARTRVRASDATQSGAWRRAFPKGCDQKGRARRCKSSPGTQPGCGSRLARGLSGHNAAHCRSVGRPHAAAEVSGELRVLATSRGLTNNNTFYLASQALSRDAALLQTLFQALTDTDARVRADRGDAVQRYAEFAGLPPAIVQRMAERRGAAPVGPLTAELVKEQQLVADSFTELGLIPRSIRVADAVATPIRKV